MERLSSPWGGGILKPTYEELEAQLEAEKLLSAVFEKSCLNAQVENTSLKARLEEAVGALENLVKAIRNNGYFEEWANCEIPYGMDVVIDGEIPKEVWSQAKRLVDNNNKEER